LTRALARAAVVRVAAPETRGMLDNGDGVGGGSRGELVASSTAGVAAAVAKLKVVKADVRRGWPGPQ
jgi:hypothetical protein